jgi:hypothetical protein
MKTETALTLTLFLVVCIVVQAAYIHTLKNRFTLDGKLYEQAGVMEIKDGDNTLYAPVFRRLTK